ncbi:MAG: DUF4910 domain-containing protein [Pirellulales bacterium]
MAESSLLQTGDNLHRLMRELFPICRSITGEGLRRTLRSLQTFIPLEIHETPSGTDVFDWTIPDEWNIREAWIKNRAGERVIDFANHSLHIVNYSVPIHRRMTLSELRPHLFSFPDRPDLIPYRTAYYKPHWGFCVAHRELANWPDGEYEVFIDSSLAPGSLSYGELYLPGKRSDEVLFTAHVCHPSLANDNLSGVVVATALAKHLLNQPEREYSYRFLFAPGTIGSITWLARNEAHVDRIQHGLVIALVGGKGEFHYKRSRRGNAAIDRIVETVLRTSGRPYQVRDFSPYGYDERQFCSPGFNLPVGSLTRTPHGEFPEYHTSGDNLDFVSPASLDDSLALYREIVRVIETNRTYLNLNPKCEPRLGKRGLYQSLGGTANAGQVELALLWVLNFADGKHSLLDIAERSGHSFSTIVDAAVLLRDHGLLSEVSA